MGNWQQTFGGNNVGPAAQGYEPIELAANTALFWSLESSSSPIVAAMMQVTPTAVNLQLQMPDATQGATGFVSIVENAGNTAFALTDTFGAQIANIAPGLAWIIFLTDNGTPAGAWLAIQLGATTSNAQAGALAGSGLQALLTQLQVFIETQYLNTSTLINSTYRASGVVWQGGASGGVLQLDTIANLTTGWWTLFSNQGTEDITISTSGTDTINQTAEIVIPAGGSGNPYSVLVVAASDGFNTFAGTPAIIPISGGGTGADNAPDALTNLGGSTIGIEIFEAPSAAAILAILGIGTSAFTEATIAANQILTPSSINTAFVCTAALQLQLPLAAAPITNQFVFAAYAKGGNVTVVPSGTDAINGVAASFVIPQGASALFVTDADGNWWPLFLSQPNGIPWAIASGTGDAQVVAYVPVDTVLQDGMLRSFRAAGANTLTDPTLTDSTLGTNAITKDGGQPLAPNDIPGANAECLVRYRSASTSWELLNPATNLDLFGNAQGDILYRDAAAWETLAPGAAGQVLMSGGPAANPSWASNTGRLLSSTSYTVHGVYNYVVPAGCTALIVEVVGAGGGGGGAAVGASQFASSAGGGGGAGAYSRGSLTDHAAGASVTVTVGQGGSGGAGAVNGVNGNNTSFGGDIVCAGGNGGVTATPNGSSGLSGVGPGGTGGGILTGGNQITTSGNTGDLGVGQNKSYGGGGNGGPGPWGGSGEGGITVNIATQINGTNGAGPGAGGGGAGVYSNGSAQTANGGNGADGAVIIYAYS